MNILLLYSALVFACLRGLSANRTYFLKDEVRSLSELPLNELIHLKSTFGVRNRVQDDGQEDDQEMEASSRTLSLSLPITMPLKSGNRKATRRHGHHYEEKGKDTKISKVFQLSVTALSFLAFGGYLLTLIITTIRQNSANNGNTNGNVILLSNLQGLQNYNRPKRNAPFLDPMENRIEVEKLYQGMILLSKSYATYNQLF